MSSVGEKVQILSRASVQGRIIAVLVYLAVILYILNSPSGLSRVRFAETNVPLLVKECEVRNSVHTNKVNRLFVYQAVRIEINHLYYRAGLGRGKSPSSLKYTVGQASTQ